MRALSSQSGSLSRLRPLLQNTSSQTLHSLSSQLHSLHWWSETDWNYSWTEHTACVKEMHIHIMAVYYILHSVCIRVVESLYRDGTNTPLAWLENWLLKTAVLVHTIFKSEIMLLVNYHIHTYMPVHMICTICTICTILHTKFEFTSLSGLWCFEVLCIVYVIWAQPAELPR